MDKQKKAVIIYKQGFTLRETAEIMRIKYKIKVSHQWVKTALDTLQ